MGKYEVSVKGFHVAGPEEDYLHVVRSDSGTSLLRARRRTAYEASIGACSLLRSATGDDAIGWDEAVAFDYGGVGESWGKAVASYRERTGRQFPALYKVKISVEAEPLPEDEVAAYWEERKADYLETLDFRRRSVDFEQAFMAAHGFTRDEYARRYRTIPASRDGKSGFEAVENDQDALRAFFETKGNPDSRQYYVDES
jgi:hypothetical protein